MDEFVKVERKGPYDKQGNKLAIGTVARLANVAEGTKHLKDGTVVPFVENPAPVRKGWPK